MTFKKLRNIIANKGPQVIKWNESGIVEVAEITENGAIRIINVITRKSYIIPRSYTDLKIKLLPLNKMVTLGSLLPKKDK